MKRQFTAKQARALTLLASGMTGTATAKAVGVKESTVSHWRNHCPSFATELGRLRDQIAIEAIGQLQASVAVAASEVRRIITKGKSEALRLRAAEYVLDNFALPKAASHSPTEIAANGKGLNLALVLEGLGITHAH